MLLRLYGVNHTSIVNYVYNNKWLKLINFNSFGVEEDENEQTKLTGFWYKNNKTVYFYSRMVN